MTRHEKTKSPNQEKIKLSKITIKNKKLFVIDVLIIIGILTSIGFAVHNLVIKPDVNVNSSMTDINKKNETMAYASFNFTSKEVFSVDNLITVSVVVPLDANFVKNNPDVLDYSVAYVYLPTASSKNAVYQYGHEMLEPIRLIRGDDGIFRNSTTEIIYHTEGDKCEIFSFIQLTSSRTCLPNAQPVIHISSIDSLYQVQSNHTNTALGWLVLAFSIAIIREFGKDFIQNISFLKNDKNDSPTQEKPE